MPFWSLLAVSHILSPFMWYFGICCWMKHPLWQVGYAKGDKMVCRSKVHWSLKLRRKSGVVWWGPSSTSTNPFSLGNFHPPSYFDLAAKCYHVLAEFNGHRSSDEGQKECSLSSRLCLDCGNDLDASWVILWCNCRTWHPLS